MRDLQQRLGNEGTHAALRFHMDGRQGKGVAATTKPLSSPPANELARLPSTIDRTQASVQSGIRFDPIQASLTISRPGDALEREADRVADAVMRVPAPSSMPANVSSATSVSPGAAIQRRCVECEEETKSNVQRKEGSAEAPQITPSVSAGITALKGGGSPLPASAREFFEPRFGADFSSVRVHTGSQAAETANAINARAFTIGRNIAFNARQYAPHSQEGRHLLAHELTHVVQQSGGQSDASGDDTAIGMRAQHGNVVARTPVPTTTTTRPVSPTLPKGKHEPPTAMTEHSAPAGVPHAEALIAAKFPHLARVLLPADYKAVQDAINWRLQTQNLNQEIAEFDRRERERAAREGMEGDSYRYLSSYNDKLERLYNKQKEPPRITEIEVDTSKLIDPSILAQQDWNVDAERRFRESWVRTLSSKPTVLMLLGNQPIEDVFRGIFWKGVPLPTEGGLITWEKLLDIPGAFPDYNSRVLHSPVAVAAEQYRKELRSLYYTAEAEYDSERGHKSRFPVVSRIAEFFSSSIDWNAASKLLPEGKSFENMSLFETMRFLGSLKEEQVDRISRVLPTSQEVLRVYQHLLNVETAVTLEKYEAALIIMPIVADEIEEIYRKTITYEQRTLEGASTVVTGLQYIRAGCNIVLTVGGGIAGKAYGLIGISAGSAAGAGIGTLTQETAMQLAEHRLDVGSILFKTGKDAAMTFVGSMIGGALASKFASILGTRLATIIPNERVRAFVIGRIADASSGLITTPIEITIDGMLEGDWPKSADDLLEKVAKNVVVSVVLGSAIDLITGVPNLKGKAWEKLTEADLPAGTEKVKATESGVEPTPVEAQKTLAKSKEYQAWKEKLSDAKTREMLDRNPKLEKTFAEMDPEVRDLLTLCDSPCIPDSATDAQAARIKALLGKLQVTKGSEAFQYLREYLHRPKNRANLDPVIKELEGLNSKADLQGHFERSIQESAAAKDLKAVRRPDGRWELTLRDGSIVTEYSIQEHNKAPGTRSFFQSHHGIQGAWGRARVKFYSYDDAPTILLRDSRMNSPHQIVSALQSLREAGVGARTYSQERLLLQSDMKAAGVPTADANAILSASDRYFAKLYGLQSPSQREAIFGDWKP
jgi:hypothetical protein